MSCFRFFRVCLYVVAVSLIQSSTAHAEVPLQLLSQLTENSSAIVIGTVVDIEATESPGYDSGVVDCKLVFHVKISAVEKGERKIGETIATKAWIRKKTPDDWVGASGHCYMPAKGETVRVFLNGSDVMLPNGFATPDSLRGVTDKAFNSLPADYKRLHRNDALALIGSSTSAAPSMVTRNGSYLIWIAIGAVVLLPLLIRIAKGSS